MEKKHIETIWIIENIKTTAVRIYDEVPSKFFINEFINSLEAFYAEKFTFAAITSKQKDQIAKSIAFRIKLFQAPSLQVAC